MSEHFDLFAGIKPDTINFQMEFGMQNIGHPMDLEIYPDLTNIMEFTLRLGMPAEVLID